MYKYILITILVLIPALSKAQDSDQVMHESRTLSLAPGATVSVSNKYGSIYISTWDKDSVKADINFYISEKNSEKSKKTKNEVDFKFDGNDEYRTIATSYSSSYSSLLKDFKETTNIKSLSNKNSYVDYYITLPKHTSLRIENKYGNIVLPDYNGDVDITLSNGSFQAGELNGANNLNLSFGTAYIDYFNAGKLILNYFDSDISKINQASIDSRSSNISIEESKMVNLECVRGNISFDKSENLYGKTQFSDIKVKEVSNELVLDLSYGKLSLISPSAKCKKLKLSSTNAPINIKLPEGNKYLLDINTYKSSINSAQNITWKTTEPESAKSSRNTIGQLGAGANSLKINIDVRNSKVNIF